MNKVIFREHRGSLAASIETSILIQDIYDLRCLFKIPDDKKINVEFYAEDLRIGWLNTHIVTAEGLGVLGFTDGPLEEYSETRNRT